MPGVYTLPQRGAWADPAGFLNTAFPTGLIGAWRFGKSGSLTDAQARQICALNKAPLGQRGFNAVQAVGTPTVHNDYFTFQNGSYVRNGDPAPPSPPDPLPGAILTNIPQPATWCAYVVVRTAEVTISPSLAIFGWYANNDGNGVVCILYSTNQYRIVSFENPTVPNAIQSALVYPNNTQSTWRVIYFDASPTEIKVQNLTHDSAGGDPGNEPAVTIPVNGNILSKRPMVIGACYQGYTKLTIDIHCLRLYSGLLHDNATKAGVLAEIRDGLTGTGITA